MSVRDQAQEFKLLKDLDATTLSFFTGLRLTYRDSWTLEVGGEADLSGDYKAYTGRALLTYSF